MLILTPLTVLAHFVQNEPFDQLDSYRPGTIFFEEKSTSGNLPIRFGSIMQQF